MTSSSATRAAVLVGWPLLVGLTIYIMSFAVGMLRDANDLRHQKPPPLPQLRSTQPADPAEVQLMQIMVMRRTRWEQDRAFQLNQAAMLYRTGLLLVILGGLLILVWTAGAIWLLMSSRGPASPPPPGQK